MSAIIELLEPRRSQLGTLDNIRGPIQLPGPGWSGKWESAVIFGIATATFVAVGVWVTVGLHVVYGDAESRLTHAYLVLWNHPAKLASIGFVWPPVQTLVLLPFAVFKPLATSLVALPVFSGMCGGALIAVLNRTLSVIGTERPWRYLMLLGFGANPLFLDYASNGMAEILNLLFLALGIHYFIRWYLGGAAEVRTLLLSGTVMAIGFLSRYELGVWINLMVLGIVWIKWRRQARYREIEASALMFLAPVAYVVVIWSALNVIIVGGSPIEWLLRAGEQNQGYAVAHPGVYELARDSFIAIGRASPLLWCVPVALAFVGVIRRERFPIFLAAMIVVQAVITFALVSQSPHVGYFQLRFQLRALPIALIGAGWLLRSVSRGRWRTVVGAIIIGVLIASAGTAYDSMRHYPYQFEDQAFARALATGQDQAGTRSIGGYLIGDPSIPRIATWIDHHVSQPKSVLVDDAALPGVILMSGRPTLFVTRTDHGDRAWARVLIHPYRAIRYVLVTASGGAAYSGDLIVQRYPSSAVGRFPGATLILRTNTVLLYRLRASRSRNPAGTPVA